MTIIGVAPRGLRRHDARRAAVRVRADHHARRDEPGLDGLREPQQLLGLPVRATQARRDDRAGARARSTRSITPIINDVEAPLQKGMSAKTLAQFKAKKLMLADGRKGQSSMHQGVADAARAAVRDHRHRAAHRVREHRESAARARREPHDGDGGASLARRDAPAAHRAGAHRVGAARRARRRREHRRRALDARRHHRDAAAEAVRDAATSR